MDATALLAAANATTSTASQQKQRGAGVGSKLAWRTKRKKAEAAAATTAKRQQARRSSASGDDNTNSPPNLAARGGATVGAATASTASQQKQRGAGGGGDEAGQSLPVESKAKSTTTTQRQPLALRAHRSRLNKTMDWNRTLDSGQPLLIPSGSTSKLEATMTTAKRSTTSKLARKKQTRMKNLAAQGGATTDATAMTAPLKIRSDILGIRFCHVEDCCKTGRREYGWMCRAHHLELEAKASGATDASSSEKQRGGGDDDADQPLLLKPKAKRQSSSGIRTNDDNTNAKPVVRAMEPASRHACGSFRGFRPRVPLKPAAAASAASANTGSDAPKEEATPEQIDLVRQVQSGAIISILWRWGRSLDNNPGHKDGACLYYSGEDEYFSAKIMQWRKVRGRRLFRLIYDDGYVENDINLLEQTFRILHLQDPDEVKEEGGLFLV